MNFPNMPQDEKEARSQMALMEAEIDQINAEFDATLSKNYTTNQAIQLSFLLHNLSADLSQLKNMDPDNRRNIMKLAFQYSRIALAQSLHRLAKVKMENAFLFSDEIFDPEEK